MKVLLSQNLWVQSQRFWKSVCAPTLTRTLIIIPGTLLHHNNPEYQYWSLYFVVLVPCRIPVRCSKFSENRYCKFNRNQVQSWAKVYIRLLNKHYINQDASKGPTEPTLTASLAFGRSYKFYLATMWSFFPINLPEFWKRSFWATFVVQIFSISQVKCQKETWF